MKTYKRVNGLVELYHGSDGKIRVADVKIASEINKRSILKLCLLPLDENIQINQRHIWIEILGMFKEPDVKCLVFWNITKHSTYCIQIRFTIIQLSSIRILKSCFPFICTSKIYKIFFSHTFVSIEISYYFVLYFNLLCTISYYTIMEIFFFFFF